MLSHPARRSSLPETFCRVFFLFVFCAAWTVPAHAQEHRLIILHTNDIHGQVQPMAARWIDPDDPPLLGGFEALAYTIEEIRTNTALEGAGFLLLDAGDIFQGTPEGNLTEGRIVVDWMNRLSYDAVALGNHELDYGQQVIGDLARRAHFPFLAANVIDRRLGQRPAWVRPWIIRHTGGLAVGIVGLTTSDMTNLVTPEPLKRAS